jgi:hypothetical protein
MAAITPLNKDRQFERSSKLLSDIKCGSFVSIPWPSNLYCVVRGVFSSTKHLGVEHNLLELRFCEHGSLFLLTTLVSLDLNTVYC